MESLDVDLVDIPAGCVLDLSEEEKVDTVMHLLMRDFKWDEEEQEEQEEDVDLHQVKCKIIIFF